MEYRDRRVTWALLVEKRFGLRKLAWTAGRPVRCLERNFPPPAHDWILARATRVTTRLASTYARRPATFPATGRIWDKAGLLPVPYHYYQPVVRASDVAPWGVEDPLAGIDLRVPEQLGLLRELAAYRDEILALPQDPTAAGSALYLDLEHGAFLSGDIETLYAMVRHSTPRTVVEIGCGSSTRVIELALRRNREEGKAGRHICVEPFEAPWLENLGIEVIRRRVETLEPDFFTELTANDVLFIDTSHVIRHGGDVRHIYLNLVPSLKPGVHVHVHDVFLPRDYPPEWLRDEKRFWTEQYLLQAFLAFNSQFEVMLAANYLSRHQRKEFEAVCPLFARENDRQPGSFWFRRRHVASPLTAPVEREKGDASSASKESTSLSES